MEERRNKWWCDAIHEYNAPDFGAAICNALTSTTTFGTWGSGELTYTATNIDDAILIGIINSLYLIHTKG